MHLLPSIGGWNVRELDHAVERAVLMAQAVIFSLRISSLRDRHLNSGSKTSALKR